MFRIGLAGNPNCGKSTLFNVLTKARQHTGNWPGVTVEKKEGILKYKGQSYSVIDLPGTYSLGAYSEDEVVARDYIIKDKPEVVVNVVDATNIERNLYLTTQILELGSTVVIALNMMDEAKKQGIIIDIEGLSKKLGVRVVPISALRGENIDILIEKILEAVKESKNKKIKLLDYGDEINNEIIKIEDVLETVELDYPSSWIALKLLENDSYINEYIVAKEIIQVREVVDEAIKIIEEKLDFEPEIAIVDKRYSLISEYIDGNVKKDSSNENESRSDKLDRIITNKWFGIPIFACIMYLLYQLTFTIGAGLQEYTGDLIITVGESFVAWLERLGAPQIVTGFINGGVFGGVGAVISFLPLIMVMYFLIGILEDSGYMARAAYVMDKFMRAIGLHGKTFVSMLIGVGCNVPGIMSTRTLDNKKDRMIALLINPFVSCGARLPIYLVFVDAFFTQNKGLILFSLYVVGIIVALIAGKIFSKTLFKGEPSYFVMELPKYRIPSIKNVSLLMLEKAGEFFKKAGIIILPMMMVLWVLSNFPFGVEEFSNESLLGQIGSLIAPIFAPAGFGTWEAGVSIFTGILAKETVVATMGMLYTGGSDGAGLIVALQTAFTPLTAISFMVFSLLYTPCLVALGAIRKETNMKWTLFTAGYTFAVAWVVAVLIYQIGRFLGF
ncbi:MAG: ferrous iron transport protein B [Sarcina sp.]